MKPLKWLFLTLSIGLLAAGCASEAGQLTAYPAPEGTSKPATEAPPTTPSPSLTSTLTPTLAVTSTGAWINLEPNSGDPGTTVQIEGYLPGGLPEDDLVNSNYNTGATLCWDGCQDGLMESVDVTWSKQEAGHFSSQFIVPPIPWLADDGLHQLKAGDYPVDILYLDPNATGCSPSVATENGCLLTPQAGAVFHLREGYNNPECQEASDCGHLKATPAQGAPGDVIQVEGWAPLLQLIGQPYGYDLVLETQQSASPQDLIYLATRQGDVVRQNMDGSLTASFQVPQYAYDGSALVPGSYTIALLAGGLTGGKNAPAVLVAPIPFEISAAPAWTQRQRSAPLWIQSSASLDSTLSLDALDPNRLAYCVDGAIQVSQDGGQSWTSISTSPITELALPGDLVLDSSPPICRSILLDASHPDSFYAVFGAMDKQYGIPPVYFLPFFTADHGKTWQLVPIPSVRVASSLVDGLFGGFWTDGKVVQALYFDETGNSSQSLTLLVKQTDDGGLSWEPASLACPPGGPCLRWGAAPGQISGMGSDLPQELLVSFDLGQSWNSTHESVELRATSPHQLAAISPDEALILSGGERYPLRYTPDSAKTWQALSLPPLPGIHHEGQYNYPGLQMLSDGSLLALDQENSQWWALPSTAEEWCSLEISPANNYPVLLQSAGSRVWWLSPGTALPESAPASSFVCAP